MDTSQTVNTTAKMATICPLRAGSNCEKAANTTFAAFSISSTPINTKMALRLVSTTYVPAENKKAAR